MNQVIPTLAEIVASAAMGCVADVATVLADRDALPRHAVITSMRISVRRDYYGVYRVRAFQHDGDLSVQLTYYRGGSMLRLDVVSYDALSPDDQDTGIIASATIYAAADECRPVGDRLLPDVWAAVRECQRQLDRRGYRAEIGGANEEV